MPRRYPALVVPLIAMLVLASLFVTQHPPIARAATTVLTVNTTNDVYPSDGVCDSVTPGGCTLRDALEVADTKPVSDTVQIEFKMPLDDPGRVLDPITGLKPWFIRPVASYNFITRDNLVVDGFTQQQVGVTNPNGPIVVIDGSNLNASLVPSGSAFVFSGSNNLIRGLAIINYKTVSAGSETFNGIGLEFTTGSNNNKVQGCYIGVDAFGRSAAANTIGISLSSNGNTIGGDRTRQDQRNVISGNLQTGIFINGSPPPTNGDASFGANNKIFGNYIGLNGFGTAAVPNGGSGIFVRRGSGNLIGTPKDPSKTIWVERNTISANGEHGIYIQDSKANQIYGNWIGTDAGGTDALGNTRDGIHIESTGGSSTGNIIGGNVNPYMRNTISGNGQYGIRLQGDRTTGTVIQSNLVGPAASGSALTGNFTQAGIRLDTGVDNTLIGGTTGPSGLLPGLGNLISGNKGDALVVDGSSQPGFTTTTDTVTIQGNNIGVTEPSGLNGGQSILPNTGRGIVVISTLKATIGGTGAASNTVAGNGGAGVVLNGNLNVTVTGNTIGLRRDVNTNIGGTGGYTAATPNGGDGIQVLGARNLRIGGPNATDGNVIGANSGNGLSLTNVFSTSIQSNKIGIASVGTKNYTAGIGNTQTGLKLIGIGAVDSTTTTTGTLIASNQLYGNGGGGMQLTSSFTTTVNANNVVQNTGVGILVDGAGFNTKITNGTVYSNTVVGIQITGTTQRASVKSVSISGNGGATLPQKGISVTPGTVPGGSFGNPNHDIDPPTGLRMNQSGRLTGRIVLTKPPAQPGPGDCQGCTFQFFTPNPKTLDGQGLTEVKNIPVTVGASGYFTATLSGGIPRQLIIIATDAAGNTAEPAIFTPNFQPLRISPQPPPLPRLASPGETVRYTHWITNDGNIDLEDVQLTTRSTRGWSVATVPPGPLTILGNGGTRQVTLTVTLPSGGTPSVWAGNVDQSSLRARSTGVTTATATVTDTTTVRGQFTLQVTPKGHNGSGLGQKGTTISYPYTLLNTGNLTGSAVVTATSFLLGPGNIPLTPEETRAAGWTTSITPTLIPLIPGAPRDTTMFLKIPNNAAAGTKVQTQLKVIVTDPLGQRTQYYTATTTVAAQPSVAILPDRTGDGVAGEIITFEHTVTNLGNTTLQLRLTGTSSLGSTVRFRSKDQANFPLSNNNTFTLGTANSPGGGVFNFYVDIRVDPRARRGNTDKVTINLSDATSGTALGSVQDTVNVTRNANSSTYLPFVRR